MAEFLDITKNLLVSLNASFKLQYPIFGLNYLILQGFTGYFGFVFSCA